MHLQEQDYVEQRLDNQLAWYEAKSSACQKSYKRLRTLEIACAALIPFLSGMAETLAPYGNWIIGALGVLIAISAGVSSLNRHQENWVQYRATAEQLKQERYFFLTSSGPYADSPGLNTLVQRVEALLAKENSTWAQVANEKRDEGDKAGEKRPV